MIAQSPTTAAPWVFPGLRLPPALCAAGATAARWRREGGEWVRPVVRPAAWRTEWDESGPPQDEWAADFPPGAEAREVAAAGVAGRSFLRAGGRIARSGAGAELRIALAKCDRYLAAPAGGDAWRWRWLPGAALPCGRLVVVARDDEFVAGIVASKWLQVWSRGRGGPPAVEAVRSLPLPWAAGLARGALSPEQEERRAAVVRAWRAAGDGREDVFAGSSAAEDLDAVVAAAYGWPAGISEAAAWARLAELAGPS